MEIESMAFLAEWRSPESGGVLNLNNADLKILNKFPWCVGSFNFFLSQSSGMVSDDQNHSSHTNMNVAPRSVSLTFNNLPIAMGFWDLHGYTPPHTSFQITMVIPIEAIGWIESFRSDDVSLSFNLSVLYEEEGNLGGRIWRNEEEAHFAFSKEYSEKKWIELLEQMGYNEKWIVELDRPKLEGYDTVMEHIRKAQDALFNKKEPEDVLRDLRAARDSFKVFYDSKKTEIEEIIDLDSPGEPNKEPKSKRIEKMYDRLSMFLNIGPHNDKYKVTYADAQLAFRQFISILSYLSGILSQIKEK